MKYFEDFTVGQSAVSEEYLVSAEEIIAFGKRWDPPPFHADAKEAEKWPLGLIASGLHSMAISVRLRHDMEDGDTATVAGSGWDEAPMRLPVRPGDRLRLRARVSGKRRPRSKPDPGDHLLQHGTAQSAPATGSELQNRRPGPLRARTERRGITPGADGRRAAA